MSDKSVWRGVGLSAGARFLVMPLTALIGILCTRLIIDNYGELSYVQYGLLVGIAGLLPFADLGLSAAVLNAVAESEDVHRDQHLQGVLLAAVRLLIISGGVIVLVAAGLTAIDAWPHLLGKGLIPGSGSLVAGVCLALVGVALPFGIGQRILTGLGKNHLTIAITGAQSPLVLVAIVVLVGLGVQAGPALAVLPYLAILILAVVLSVVAGRQVSPTLRQAVRSVPTKAKGGKVSHVAWPMLILMMATPIAMQTDRIVLSHVSTVGELAEYSLAAQMFLPIWHLSSAAGMALWPVFAKERARGERSGPATYAMVFAGIATVAAVAVCLASGLLSRVASGGTIHIGLDVLIAFSALQIFQAAKYPFGVYLTDSRGLKFQVLMVLAMLPVNLGLSIVLGGLWGAVGPIIGSAIGVLLFQFVANWWYAARVRRQHAEASSDEGEDDAAFQMMELDDADPGTGTSLPDPAPIADRRRAGTESS